MKLGLMENQSIISFDARLNLGCTPKIRRQLALCMLKNIEKMRANGHSIKKELLVPELYSYRIPPAILKGLGLKGPEEPQRSKSRAGSSQARRSQSAMGSQQTLGDATIGS